VAVVEVTTTVLTEMVLLVVQAEVEHLEILLVVEMQLEKEGVMVVVLN
jgi:hypothetical protein